MRVVARFAVPVRPTTGQEMTQYDAPFEIHVHGDVRLRPEVGFDALQDALKPLWK